MPFNAQAKTKASAATDVAGARNKAQAASATTTPRGYAELLESAPEPQRDAAAPDRTKRARAAPATGGLAQPITGANPKTSCSIEVA